MNPLNTGRFNRNILAALHDGFVAAASFLLALYVRVGDDFSLFPTQMLFFNTVLFTVICITVFVWMRVYRGLWRYASMRDMMTLVKAVSLSMLIFAVALFLVNRLEAMPRSVFFINWMLLLCMLGGPRFLYRAFRERSGFARVPTGEIRRIPVLLIGANNHAEQFIRHLARDPRAEYMAAAIADDDPQQKGRTIHGVSIYGSTDMLASIVQKMERKGQRPQKLVLTDENFSAERIQQLLETADKLSIPLARLPRLSQFRSGLSERPEIQPIAVEDLLGRSQNVLDREAMRALVQDKKILVTGAGGTIGGELARQIASYRPSQLILIELSEFHLYQIERELRNAFPELPLAGLLSDIRDMEHIDNIFAQHAPDIVFHAAAIKHVPIAEFNIEETVLTNVFGTRNIAEACRRYHTSAMVMISTDKAVNPTNVMGAAKRLAESYCQGLGEAGCATKFITVRFGNVLGSTGSVVPLFTEQLARGGPITVTHPEMTRYFMTVREAVELVLQAAVLGNAMKERRECIFVLDMGKPMRIVDLATQMIRLAGLRPEEDIEIVFTGLRPGEKLHEELFHSSENAVKTSHQSIFLASPRACDITLFAKALDQLFAACRSRNAGDALTLLKRLVPEFTHQHSNHENQTRTPLRIV